MSFDQHVAGLLKSMVNQPEFASRGGLESALRLLAKWRSKLIDNTVVARHGTVIQGGPFRGMAFVAETSEANVSPKLLGSYESELHSIIDIIRKSGFVNIVDIGCADGYYAVGFAKIIPSIRVYAYDINPVARDHCNKLAELNEVSDRISIGERFTGDEFYIYQSQKTLIFMDAEGAEDGLLNPELFPSLKNLSILVECHDMMKPGLSRKIEQRFQQSHDIQRINAKPSIPELPAWFAELSHFDQLLAAWEWRAGPTPWLFMQPKS